MSDNLGDWHRPETKIPSRGPDARRGVWITTRYIGIGEDAFDILGRPTYVEVLFHPSGSIAIKSDPPDTTAESAFKVGNGKGVWPKHYVNLPNRWPRFLRTTVSNRPFKVGTLGGQPIIILDNAYDVNAYNAYKSKS